MKKIRNKRGQFYLVAAIIIIAVIVGSVTIYNSSKKIEDNELSNLEEELNIEIEKTIEYVSNNYLSNSETNILFTNFSSNYISMAGGSKNLLFLFGNQSSIILKGYRVENSENLSINIGSGFENLTTSSGGFEQNFSPTIANITIKEGFDEFVFELKQGQNFYYLISKEDSGEKIIIKK